MSAVRNYDYIGNDFVFLSAGKGRGGTGRVRAIASPVPPSATMLSPPHARTSPRSCGVLPCRFQRCRRYDRRPRGVLLLRPWRCRRHGCRLHRLCPLLQYIVATVVVFAARIFSIFGSQAKWSLSSWHARLLSSLRMPPLCCCHAPKNSGFGAVVTNVVNLHYALGFEGGGVV